jgi:hypothetical protein
VNVFQFDSRIVPQIFSQARDKYIQAAAKEIVIIAPKCFQYLLSFQDAVNIARKQPQQLGFLNGKLLHFFTMSKRQLFKIKLVRSQFYSVFYR